MAPVPHRSNPIHEHDFSTLNSSHDPRTHVSPLRTLLKHESFRPIEDFTLSSTSLQSHAVYKHCNSTIVGRTELRFCSTCTYTLFEDRIVRHYLDRQSWVIFGTSCGFSPSESTGFRFHTLRNTQQAFKGVPATSPFLNQTLPIVGTDSKELRNTHTCTKKVAAQGKHMHQRGTQGARNR